MYNGINPLGCRFENKTHKQRLSAQRPLLCLYSSPVLFILSQKNALLAMCGE